MNKAQAIPSDRAPGAASARLAWRALVWRLHFWAALIATPLTVVAVLTGILYIFTPQIEAFRYGALEHVAAAGSSRPLDEAVAAARAAAPAGWQLQSVLPPFATVDTVKVVFEKAVAPAPAHANGNHSDHAPAPAATTGRRPPQQALTVYVNPYTSEVLGSLRSDARFGNWAKTLHSRLLQGDGWRWMIELAASAMMIMLVSGLLLWWPASLRQALPNRAVRGRLAWKQWHGVLGAALALLTFVILSTGLTWSKYAGAQIRTARDLAGQAPPRVPATISSAIPHQQTLLTWQQVWQVTRQRAPAVAVQLTPPRGLSGVWRINGADPASPTRRFDMLLDAFSGQPLYFSGWDQQTAFGKATALGIPFHRGEFGWWNQALLLLFGLGVLFSLVSGWVMCFQRWQRGGAILPAAPASWRNAMPIAVGTALMSLLIPLAGAIGAAIVALELSIDRRQRSPSCSERSR
ncbi:PepSY-associated TM helix domain-containing protein [Massilia sp. PWRC2]|uniref:PepSY-associated TM helix domain-containing protein n=1 Tax=Massilia sp. PWRC2 TaxID=2804626 RepID=UPI003CE75816